MTATFFNDLLPLPYTDATLARGRRPYRPGAGRARPPDAAGKPLDLPRLRRNHLAETDFLAELARRTGCGLLLDVNNVFVAGTNRQTDPYAYIDAFPLDAVGEIHLGGHDAQDDEHGAPLLIDSHGAEVVDPVWALYAYTIGASRRRADADRMGQ